MFASCQLFFFDIKGKRWGNRLFSEKNALILQNEVIKVSPVNKGTKVSYFSISREADCRSVPDSVFSDDTGVTIFALVRVFSFCTKSFLDTKKVPPRMIAVIKNNRGMVLGFI